MSDVEIKEADPYEVLGVEPTASSAQIKKQYWRLSLLIHPDKCSHPRANDAFQAVSKVSKELQVTATATCLSPEHSYLYVGFTVEIRKHTVCWVPGLNTLNDYALNIVTAQLTVTGGN